MADRSPRTFLTAEWLNLVMINYEVNPRVLTGMTPSGTELDSWNGRTFVSLVGFLFMKTRVFGLRIPFHSNFEEINLRYYVRRKGPDGWRRGVVFVREIVPRIAVAATARLLYGEMYAAFPMKHEIATTPGSKGKSVSYSFRNRGHWSRFGVTVSGSPGLAEEGSQEEFITEHYWGYTGLRKGGSLEYRVEHPRWQVWRAESCEVEIEAEATYGHTFADCFKQEPASAFLADGSEVAVKMGVRI